MKTTYFLASLAAAAVAAAPATAASLNSGTTNVPKYISDNGEGSLKITHAWASKAKLPRRRSDMSATTVGDAVYLVGGCTQDQGYAEFGGDNSTWGMCE